MLDNDFACDVIDKTIKELEQNDKWNTQYSDMLRALQKENKLSNAITLHSEMLRVVKEE